MKYSTITFILSLILAVSTAHNTCLENLALAKENLNRFYIHVASHDYDAISSDIVNIKESSTKLSDTCANINLSEALPLETYSCQFVHYLVAKFAQSLTRNTTNSFGLVNVPSKLEETLGFIASIEKNGCIDEWRNRYQEKTNNEEMDVGSENDHQFVIEDKDGDFYLTIGFDDIDSSDDDPIVVFVDLNQNSGILQDSKLGTEGEEEEEESIVVFVNLPTKSVDIQENEAILGNIEIDIGVGGDQKDSDEEGEDNIMVFVDITKEGWVSLDDVDDSQLDDIEAYDKDFYIEDDDDTIVVFVNLPKQIELENTELRADNDEAKSGYMLQSNYIDLENEEEDAIVVFVNIPTEAQNLLDDGAEIGGIEVDIGVENSDGEDADAIVVFVDINKEGWVLLSDGDEIELIQNQEDQNEDSGMENEREEEDDTVVVFVNMSKQNDAVEDEDSDDNPISVFVNLPKDSEGAELGDMEIEVDIGIVEDIDEEEDDSIMVFVNLPNETDAISTNKDDGEDDSISVFVNLSNYNQISSDIETVYLEIQVEVNIIEDNDEEEDAIVAFVNLPNEAGLLSAEKVADDEEDDESIAVFVNLPKESEVVKDEIIDIGEIEVDIGNAEDSDEEEEDTIVVFVSFPNETDSNGDKENEDDEDESIAVFVDLSNHNEILPENETESLEIMVEVSIDEESDEEEKEPIVVFVNMSNQSDLSSGDATAIGNDEDDEDEDNTISVFVSLPKNMKIAAENEVQIEELEVDIGFYGSDLEKDPQGQENLNVVTVNTIDI